MSSRKSESTPKQRRRRMCSLSPILAESGKSGLDDTVTIMQSSRRKRVSDTSLHIPSTQQNTLLKRRRSEFDEIKRENKELKNQLRKMRETIQESREMLQQKASETSPPMSEGKTLAQAVAEMEFALTKETLQKLKFDFEPMEEISERLWLQSLPCWLAEGSPNFPGGMRQLPYRDVFAFKKLLPDFDFTSHF